MKAPQNPNESTKKEKDRSNHDSGNEEVSICEQIESAKGVMQRYNKALSRLSKIDDG